MNEYEFVWSIRTLKSCKGRTDTDSAYIHWFLRQVEWRTVAPIGQLRELIDGDVALRPDSLNVALAARAELRRMYELLREAASFFEAIPELASRFSSARENLMPKIEIADEVCSKVSLWFRAAP